MQEHELLLEHARLAGQHENGSYGGGHSSGHSHAGRRARAGRTQSSSTCRAAAAGRPWRGQAATPPVQAGRPNLKSLLHGLREDIARAQVESEAEQRHAEERERGCWAAWPPAHRPKKLRLEKEEETVPRCCCCWRRSRTGQEVRARRARVARAARAAPASRTETGDHGHHHHGRHHHRAKQTELHALRPRPTRLSTPSTCARARASSALKTA